MPLALEWEEQLICKQAPGCHGSQRLFLGVWHNPTGRAYAVVYFCISVSFGGMRAAKVGKVIRIFVAEIFDMYLDTQMR